VTESNGNSLNKVLLSNSSVYPLRLESAFQIAQKTGYDGMEVLVWSDKATQTSRSIRNLSRRYEMPIGSIHAPNLFLSPRVWHMTPIKKLEHTVHLAVDLDVETIVVHPPFFYQPKYSYQFVEQIHELEEKYDVTLAVENMYPVHIPIKKNYLCCFYKPGWDPSLLPFNNLTLDISHAGASKTYAMDLAAKFDKRLSHVHIADATFRKFDEHLVPGRGTMDCKEFLNHTADLSARLNKQISVAVEISTRSVKDINGKMAMISEALEFSRTHLKSSSSASKNVQKDRNEDGDTGHILTADV